MKNQTIPKAQAGPAHHVMLTAADFAQLGSPHLAFVRKVADDEGAAQWAIFSADGTPIGMAPTREVAFAAVRQHEMEPLSVH